MLGDLPDDLVRQVFTHASWTDRRADSYERLAFLGDSVLSLALTTSLYPSLDPDQYGAGRLTKVRAQAVSGRACREVADRLGVADRLRATAPTGAGRSVEDLVATERVLASVMEAIIGGCYLVHGFETTAAAVVEAFAPEVRDALENPLDFKSALQEQLARRGEVVVYTVEAEDGPPHDRTFEIAASVGDRELGRGVGRSKKDAEQAAAAESLDRLRR